MPVAEELPWFDACQENHPEHTALLLYLLLEKKVWLRKWETVGVSVPQIAGTRGKGGKGTDSDYTLTPVSKKVSRQELCPHVNNFPPTPRPNMRFRNLISGLWFSMAHMALHVPRLPPWQDRHPIPENVPRFLLQAPCKGEPGHRQLS